MTRTTIAGAAFAAVLVLLALGFGLWDRKHHVPPAPATSTAIAPPIVAASPETAPTPEAYQGFLYGRVATVEGATYEGRLRWGANEEAFWDDAFNGSKHENLWVALVPPERLPKERQPVEIFGIKVAEKERELDLRRLFVERFGDIARVEANGKEVLVTLKSGTVYVLDRFEASDFDDGVQVWNARGDVVELDSLQIDSIEFLPTPAVNAVPSRLQGTVRTRQGEFTGFVSWNRDECVGTDELDGRVGKDEVSLRFDTIRSIERHPHESVVTLIDGRDVVLSNNGEVGRGNQGIYVDDPRYGRVLIPGAAFERVDFVPGGSGPAYGDFPPGRPLQGSITTRDGRRLAGRLVYDLDESETTDVLDAPSQGVNYAIPFGLIASIVPQHGKVTLRSGVELQLEAQGDLGERNAGMLIFVDGRERPEYVPWADVERVDLDGPPAAGSPAGER
jgi:hypothetical protein